MALSPEIQKISDYLNRLLASGKKFNLSLEEIKKKAKAPNAETATISAFIKREQNKGNFKNLSIKKFTGRGEVGVSKVDEIYKKNKKFRDFVNQTIETPYKDLEIYQKSNAYKSFLLNQKLVKGAKGFTLTPTDMAKKLGLPLQTLRTYESKPNQDTSTRFIADNIKKIRTVGVNPTTGLRETVVR